MTEDEVVSTRSENRNRLPAKAAKRAASRNP